MSHSALTQRYRPQTFADVAGQATLKAILSRAAAEDKIAPAYLFSGTRGVGKTTIARIFAKALNCKNAPGPEPCNQCESCRAITLGGSVDVVEIDGASNRGIDDVRRLKESVGYAPMDGRYKIFIIDEAHMLSREAFNALLKTLEEPPTHVTFIMATTEAHKFPVTILSRCQHYVFKRLSDAELEAHLSKILKLENLPFEPMAVRLIVRRAAGSVRDAMSLLGQVLALGGDSLSEAESRMVLGLAGQELFFKLLAQIKAADCPAISLLVREMLDQGLDLGFFLRELSTMWRNLFMLRQAGEAARGVLDLPEAEVERWLAEARTLELGHIHAAWQMSLEGQRRVLTSLEPALALELLLLNLAMLPKLLSLEQISLLSRKVGSGEAEKKSPLTEPDGPDTAAARPAGKLPEHLTEPESQTTTSAESVAASRAAEAVAGAVTQEAAVGAATQEATAGAATQEATAGAATQEAAAGAIPGAALTTVPGSTLLNTATSGAILGAVLADAVQEPQDAPEELASPSAKIPPALQPAAATAESELATAREAVGTAVISRQPAPADLPETVAQLEAAPERQTVRHSENPAFARVQASAPDNDKPENAAFAEERATPDQGNSEDQAGAKEQKAPDGPSLPADSGELAAASVASESHDTAAGGESVAHGKEGDWEAFVHFCSKLSKASSEIPVSLAPLLRKIQAVWQSEALSLTPPDLFSAGRLEDKKTQELIKILLRRFCGCSTPLRLLPPPDRETDKAKLRERLEKIPAIKAFKNELGAQVIDYAPWRG